MLSFLKQKNRSTVVPDEQVNTTYKRYRLQALLSVFLGYLSYYIVRNNFTLSTPYLKEHPDACTALHEFFGLSDWHFLIFDKKLIQIQYKHLRSGQ